MKLEANDRRFPYYVCVATIEDVRGEGRGRREGERDDAHISDVNYYVYSLYIYNYVLYR